MLKSFKDGQDNGKFYGEGHTYPKGNEPTKERIEFLVSEGFIQDKEECEKLKRVDLESMKKDELIALANKRKVEFDSKITKAELIDLLV